ncbi:MAG: RagB/SusD family nutrient uptake outer membrane protein [Arachidicoccus sp.]|nr:RagB/SusD family nutrient uptake outer membrane protein [Arachidicoccus sp.]
MKTRFYYSVLLMLIAVWMSCQKNGFLDQTSTTSLNEAATFSDSANAMDFLNNIYVNIGFASDPKRFNGGNYAAGLDASCDEAESPNSSSTNGFIEFATGTVNPTIVPDDAWKIPYANIRAVNQFLKHLPVIPFSSSLKTETKAEARFLRAWYYFMLLEHYGGVPLIGDTIYSASDQVPQIRNSFESCVNYIAGECDAAAQDLPLTQSGSNYGRASKGTCLALKARLYLYAASPLFNNGGIGKTEGNGMDTIVAYPDSDPNRWQRAANAAEQIILLNAYSLYVDSTSKSAELGYGFQELFTQRYNNEYILPRMMDANKYLEGLWDVPSRGGSGGPFPYQEIVDAFPMSNGKAITDPASGYDPNNPYKNRDPRLGYSIIHDSTLRTTFGANQPSPVLLYWNTKVSPAVAASGDAVYKGTPTGYYIFKMLDPSIIQNGINQSARCLPLIRYAEILLDYAEAQNEYLGPDQTVYQAIEAIRQRAGIRPYLLPDGLTKEEMRKIIRKERQVELAYEGHRFFDVRRWMIADSTQNQQMHGLEVDRGNTVTYKVFNVRKHNFKEAMYLWPLPLSEISKLPQLQQNPQY